MNIGNLAAARGAGLLCSGAVLVAVYLLKRFYSLASAEELCWILGPTAAVVELVSGLSFVYEPGLGWFNSRYEVVIAPSCGGVNFLIIMFCMSAFQGISRLRTCSSMLIWIGSAGLMSYLVALLVNSLRIWASIYLYQADFYSGGLTVEAVHRILGVSIYYIFLCFYYLFVSFILRKGAAKFRTSDNGVPGFHKAVTLLIPLGWYLFFSLGVPLLRDVSVMQTGSFLAHAVMVGSTAGLLTLLLFPAVYGCRFLSGLRRN